jgi:hypothetical protein
MNNLYRKVALTSVGIALGFALGVNKEVKAATIILTPATSFALTNGGGYYRGVPFHVGEKTTYESGQWGPEERPFTQEHRAFYEFNIANLSLPSNTVISNAIFRVKADLIDASHRSFAMNLFGYIGNGQPDYSDYEAAPYKRGLSYNNLGFRDPTFNYYLAYFVAPFVNEAISKNDAFLGFSFQVANYAGYATLNDRDASLIITTVDVPEPVPEPTTIFGSFIGLCLGGWLKRKNSNGQNKITLEN